jgi:group I intron endonuclease
MRLCGIYNIVNKINGKIYIGSSNDINRRFYIHKRKLNKNSHDNKHLQLSWNKYGINNFELKIIERCNEDVLLLREQYYLDDAKNNKEKCYNSNFISTKPPSPLGKKSSVETRNKLSILRLGSNNPQYGKKLSNYTKKKMSESRSKKDYFFISPQNKIVCIRNLKLFCRENDLNNGGMYNVQTGRIKQYKGWTLSKNDVVSS